MDNYNVIIVLDEPRNRSYYYSHGDSDGNIECAELPPYADINKARSCYWDGNKWIFDSDKYAEIKSDLAAEREAAEKEAAEAEAIPTNADLAEAVMELGDNVNTLMEAVAELAGEMVAMKGGE